MAKRDVDEIEQVKPGTLPPAPVEVQQQPSSVAAATAPQTKQVPRPDYGAIRANVEAWLSTVESTGLEDGKQHTLTIGIGAGGGFTSTPKMNAAG